MHPLSLDWFLPFLQGLGLGVVAMLLHECGHIVTAMILGVKVKRVGFQWNKGLYSVREQGSPGKNLLIALGGPLVNMLLVAASPWSAVFGLANFCYALANMLPIEGSDGFRIANCWQQIRSKDLII
jgi:Zn-dependent protease